MPSSGESSRSTSLMSEMVLFCPMVSEPANGLPACLSSKVCDWWALAVCSATSAKSPICAPNRPPAKMVLFVRRTSRSPVEPPPGLLSRENKKVASYRSVARSNCTPSMRALANTIGDSTERRRLLAVKV